MKKAAVLVYSLRGGGAERVAANLMNRLTEDYEVTAILLEERIQDHDYDLLPGVEIRVVPDILRRLPGYEWRKIRALKKLKKQKEFDVCISFLERGNLYNVLSRQKEKVYVSIRNMISMKDKLQEIDPWESAKKRLYYREGKKYDLLADRVICVSEDAAADQIRNYQVPEEKIRVIRNWVDADYVREQARLETDDREFGEFREKYRFLFVSSGRLNPQKGQWHLIRAFAKLHREYPDTGLYILGDGPIRDRIRKAAEVSGANDAILLCGRKRNPFAYLGAADVFVLPSLFEGCPNTVLEAMAAGLPVICDDCPGIRELLTPERAAEDPVVDVSYDGFGVVSRRLDASWRTITDLDDAEESLYKAMKRFREEPELCSEFSKRGEELIRNYTKEKIIRQWIDVIEEGI